MGTFSFLCKKCKEEYDVMVPFDKTGKYAKVVCPECGSKKKEQFIAGCQHKFAQPEGTDRWTSPSKGHDYRYKTNIPKVAAERAMAEAMSHMGANPYQDTSVADFNLDTGIHDAESRPGLS